MSLLRAALHEGLDQYDGRRPKSPSQLSLTRNYNSTSRSKKFRKFCWLVGLIFIMTLPQTSAKQVHELLCKYLEYKEGCYKSLNETFTQFANKTFCPGFFDQFICWPHTLPGAMASEPCPSFVKWPNETLLAYRMCDRDGTWMMRNISGKVMPWINRKQCDTTKIIDYEPETTAQGPPKIIGSLQNIYTAGYSFSIICMVIALLILIFFKKLHCTRNYIHMNLMLSFIIRYVAVIVKDIVIQSHYKATRGTLNLSDGELAQYCDNVAGTNGLMVSCRLVLSLMHYAIIANYFWLLAEGIYLQLLLVFVMTEYKYFPIFMAFGWGAPWIPLGIWVALRISFENEGCWEFYEVTPIWWVIRTPVLISIAINFFIFINIIRIIVSKLRANNMTRTDYKYRLARSTLALIPLLGIHYIVFMVFSESTLQNRDVLNTKFVLEFVLTSLQGSLIAILYCFLNGEVQAEIRKCWRNWRWQNGLPAPSGILSTYRTDTQMTSITYAHSIDKGDAHETSLLSPNDRTDTGFNSRRSTASCVSEHPTRPDETREKLVGNGHASPNHKLVV